jgi:hypothetical protein
MSEFVKKSNKKFLCMTVRVVVPVQKVNFRIFTDKIILQGNIRIFLFFVRPLTMGFALILWSQKFD